MKNIKSVLKEVYEESKPDKKDIDDIEKNLKGFISKIKGEIKKSKIDAELFIGGSFARGTMMRSNEYDVDIFIRFNKKHKEISDITEKLLKNIEKTRVHGSRDYFKIKITQKITFEVVPVLKIKTPKEAENITDLSFFHVNYIKKKIKSQKVLDEILIAKAFCHANDVYGAESYIKGFSGYSIELLIYNCGSFIRFLKEISKAKDKIFIDIEKQYKNKQEISINMNGAKLISPIILVDPTYKQRNALAALSDETFEKFVKKSMDFLKKPSKKFFEKEKIDFDKLRNFLEDKKDGFVEVEVKTNKQEGDIAGTKLLKFYNFLSEEISKFYIIKNKKFFYNQEKTAKYFFSVKNKGEILFNGPKTNDKSNVKKFRERHKKTFVKDGRFYAKEENKHNIKDFLNSWIKKNKRQISEMSVKTLKLS